MTKQIYTGLIAEDEPLLATNLQTELARCWPDLRIVANLSDGATALQQILIHQPDLLFLDIHMPHMSGLEVAEALAEDWPENGQPLPLIVFVTAYDQYAVQAFEQAAFDYVLKPVQSKRLALCVQRLQTALTQRNTQTTASHSQDALTAQLHALIKLTQSTARSPNRLRVLQVSAGNIITMVAIDQIIYFEAADKYLRVFTAKEDYVIRSTLREIQTQLDPELFWQIHRSTIVRIDAIKQAVRHENGKLILSLYERTEQLQVSRLYTHLFKGL